MEDHEHILDDFKTPNNRYGNKAFSHFVIAAIAYLIPIGMVMLISLDNKRKESLSTIIALFYLVGFLFSVLGLINGIRSIRRKEKSSWQRTISLVGNILLCIFAISLIIISAFDIYRAIQ